MPPDASLPSQVAVVVVGAGVIGAAVAWHLAARGTTDVLLVDGAADADSGEASTLRATGGYRAQFSTPINVQLSLLAREALRRFADDTGVDPHYRPVGYLFLAHDAATLATLARAQAVQHALGLHEATMLDAAAAQGVAPHAALDGAVGAAWCPSDGTIRPREILRGFRDDAVRRGVRVAWDARVTAFARDGGGRITGVTVTRGDGERATVRCDVVVNAAGAWAADVAALADVALPVRPVRRQVAVAMPVPALHDALPMTIWTRDGFHLRVRDGQALLNWPVDTPAPHPTSLALHRPWLDAVRAFTDARVPALRGVPFDDAAHWAGLYELTPDRTVILDRAPGCANLVLVNGSSGHGVMHSPALGRLAAELILDGRATTLDITPLRLARFAEGAAHPVSDVI
ncbi:MAG: FAD-binding oxidoreductase [Gemmatimonadaceae bacterium]|nr:FAD-binding oxidoreductase [Gemmatimonadaceae bacterium]